MNTSFFKWWMLAIPGIVFVVILIIILLRLPTPEPVSTENTDPNATSASQSSTITETGSTKSQMELLNKQIVEFKLDDVQLASPNFDRKIELPKE